MSVQEIKEQLKSGIEQLSASAIKSAGKELAAYLDYLQSKKEMPNGLKLSFAQFLELENSLLEEEKGKTIPGNDVFKSMRRKYS